MKRLGIGFLVLMAFLAWPRQVNSQPCSVDLSFAPALNPGAVVYVVTLQTNGQILIGGTFDSIGTQHVTNVARLNPDGTLDSTFQPGLAADRGYVDTIAVQRDGKVIVGGSFYSTSAIAPANLARLNPDGTVDNSFDPFLFVDAPVNAVIVQSDGQILFGGSFVIVDGLVRRSVARLHSDGTLDETFDACVASSAGSGATSLALQSDGKILASGTFVFSTGFYRNGIARLGLCGEFDATYAPQPGINSGSTAYTLALRSNETVVLAGNFRTYHGSLRGGIVQLTTSGTLDADFDPGTGIPSGATIYPVAIQNDGKAIVGGDFTEYNGQPRRRIARINLDGSLDVACDPGFGPNDAVSSIAIQSDGRLLVAGKFNSFSNLPRNGLVRLNGDPIPSRLGPPIQMRNGQFQLTFYGENRTRYAIQASSNLLNWVSITNFTSNGAAMPIVDAEVNSLPDRFYRAVSTP